MSENKGFEGDDNRTVQISDCTYSTNDEGQSWCSAGKINSVNGSTAATESNGDDQSSLQPEAWQSFFHVDTHMIPSKIAYGLTGAYTGAFVPFINVFLTSIGLSVSEAGFIGGMRLVSSSIAGPLWGFLADHTGYRKLIFTVLCMCTAVTIFSLPWVAKAITDSSSNNTHPTMWTMHADKNDKYLSVFSVMDEPLEVIEPVSMPRDFIPHNNRTQITFTSKPGYAGPLFYSTLIIVFISNIFDVPLQGFVDSFVMNIAKSRPYNVCFGMQRVFGSVSFGLANFIAGICADNYNTPAGLSKYTAVFLVFLPCILLLIPAGIFLLNQTEWPSTKSNSTEEDGGCKSVASDASKSRILAHTFKQLDNLLFILSVFFIGIASAVLLGFLFQIMEDEMEASKTTMGLAVLISCLIQVFLFPLADRIIMRLGALTCIEIAMLSYFVRFLLVSYLENPWFVIPTQLFHCLGFALFWSAAIEHTQDISPKEIYVTMYSVLSSVYYGFGGVVGNICGGVVYTHYGGRMLFRTTGILCGIWTLVMLGYYQGKDWWTRKASLAKTAKGDRTAC